MTLRMTHTDAPIVQTDERPVPGLGTVASVQAEVDDVLADMREFWRAEPDQVMAASSAHLARLVEMSVRIDRVSTVLRYWKPVGAEVERVTAALKDQFQIASRLISVRQLDQELTTRG